MSSPVLEYLASYGIDPAYIMIGLFVLIVFLSGLCVVILCKLKRTNRLLKRFMSGKDMESMEDTLLKCFDRLEALEESDVVEKKQIEEIYGRLQIVYQKSGLVKYDAFREMRGELSYALALLDKNNSGVLINSMYNREGCYSYVKEIIRGESSINLSEEEEEALKKAMDKDVFVE